MTQTTFTDDVVIQGSQDIAQLQVKANTTQTQPLQNWQDSSSNPLVQITADGKLQLGDPGLIGTPTAQIEANQTMALPSPKSQRGWHSLGKVSGVIGSAITWAFTELRLLGTGGVSGLHIAQHAQLTLDSTSTMVTSAELRGGDFVSSNAAGTSGMGNAVGQATGSRSTASNAANAYLTTAVGVEGAISNDTSGNIGQASAFSAVVPTNNGTMTSLAAYSMAPLPTPNVVQTLYGLQLPDLTQGSVANYALYTRKGVAHLGDVLETPVLSAAPTTNPPSNFVQLYTKLNSGVPQLYALNSSGTESQLGNTGSVTSVGLSLPNVFVLSGTPVTTTGTLTATLANQTPNTVWTGPTSGAASAPTFRILTAADLSSALATPPAIGLGTPSTAAFSNVAINQSSPSARLHVKDSLAPQAVIESTSTASGWLEFRDGATAQHRMALVLGQGSATDGKFGVYDVVKTTNRFAIDTNGFVGINQINPLAILHVKGSEVIENGSLILGSNPTTSPIWGINLSGNDLQFFQQPNLTTGGVGHLFLKNDGSTVFVFPPIRPYNDSTAALQIQNAGGTFTLMSFNTTSNTTTVGGTLQMVSDAAFKPTTNTWTIGSDERLKNNIQPFSDGLDILRHLQPISYTLNGKGGMPHGVSGIGLSAQKVKDVIPYTISTFKAKFNPEDAEETDLYGFNSSALTFVMINAFKEIDQRLANLEKK